MPDQITLFLDIGFPYAYLPYNIDSRLMILNLLIFRSIHYIDIYLEAGTRRTGVEELAMILPPWSIKRGRVGSLLMWF